MAQYILDTLEATQMNATNGFFQTSDTRKKNIGNELNMALCYNFLEHIVPFMYTLKDSSALQLGLSAQEVQKYFPEIVSTDAEGYLSVDYAKLSVILIEILKDINNRLTKLENKQ